MELSSDHPSFPYLVHSIFLTTSMNYVGQISLVLRSLLALIFCFLPSATRDWGLDKAMNPNTSVTRFWHPLQNPSRFKLFRNPVLLCLCIKLSLFFYLPYRWLQQKKRHRTSADLQLVFYWKGAQTYSPHIQSGVVKTKKIETWKCFFFIVTFYTP